MEALRVKAEAFALTQRLSTAGALVYLPRGDQDYAIEVGLRMLVLRRIVLEERGLFAANPAEQKILDYSRLMADDEPATLRELNEFRELFRERIEAHRGRLIDTAGDSVLAEFASPVEAVACATELQQQLARRNAQFAEHRRMQFRIGINLGDVIEEHDAIYGDGVNVAARLQALAEPGGVCVSGTVFDQVEGKLPAVFKFLGEQQVKNIPKPIRTYRLLPERVVGPKAGPRSRAAVIAGVVTVAIGVAGAAWWYAMRPGPPQVDQQAVAGNRAASVPSARPRLAVLPLDNFSANADDEYFSDGMTEELISRLSRLGGLDVIARTSVMQYKGTTKSIADIGRDLNVSTVLEGSVRKAGDKVRITVQLIDVRSQGHLWSEDYDRDLRDIFATHETFRASWRAVFAGMTSLLSANSATLNE